jgi:hypothetical protein
MPLELLPITDAQHLRVALVRDRGQRFNERQAELLQALPRIIDHHFAIAQSIYAELTGTDHWKPSPEAAIRAAAKLYQLWGYVDGLIYGKGEGQLSSDVLSGFRRQWNDKCDQAFGDLVGATLKLQQ